MAATHRIGTHDMQKPKQMKDSAAFVSSLAPTLRLQIHYIYIARKRDPQHIYYLVHKAAEHKAHGASGVDLSPQSEDSRERQAEPSLSREQGPVMHLSEKYEPPPSPPSSAPFGGSGQFCRYCRYVANKMFHINGIIINFDTYKMLRIKNVVYKLCYI